MTYAEKTRVEQSRRICIVVNATLIPARNCAIPHRCHDSHISDPALVPKRVLWRAFLPSSHRNITPRAYTSPAHRIRPTVKPRHWKWTKKVGMRGGTLNFPATNCAPKRGSAGARRHAARHKNPGLENKARIPRFLKNGRQTFSPKFLHGPVILNYWMPLMREQVNPEGERALSELCQPWNERDLHQWHMVGARHSKETLPPWRHRDQNGASL